MYCDVRLFCRVHFLAPLWPCVLCSVLVAFPVLSRSKWRALSLRFKLSDWFCMVETHFWSCSPSSRVALLFFFFFFIGVSLGSNNGIMTHGVAEALGCFADFLLCVKQLNLHASLSFCDVNLQQYCFFERSPKYLSTFSGVLLNVLFFFFCASSRGV